MFRYLQPSEVAKTRPRLRQHPTILRNVWRVMARDITKHRKIKYRDVAAELHFQDTWLCAIDVRVSIYSKCTFNPFLLIVPSFRTVGLTQKHTHPCGLAP